MGGGVMRAAAAASKVAGVGISDVAAGTHGVVAPLPTVEYSRFSATSRTAVSRPASALLFSSPAKTDVCASRATAHSLVLDADDWEFAGGEEELGSDSEFPTPRLVFGPVPTLDEAKSATSQVKDALENAISPPNMFGFRRPMLWNTCNTNQNLAAPAQNHAIQAFKLLKENPSTQTVVASIASDPNVWNAVMQNDALTEYIQSQKTNASHSDIDGAESASDGRDSWFAKVVKETGNRFMDFMQNVNHTFIEMVNKASGFARDIFKGARDPGNSEYSDKEGFMGSPLGAALMALAVSVIMVVVLRRH